MQKVANSDAGKRRITTIAKTRFALAKIEFLREFDNDPVTKEIESGIGADNISNTLGNNADLFSFIGFDEGTTPIADLRQVLEEEVTMSRPTLINVNAAGALYNFSLKQPTASIHAATLIPWEQGKSWAEGIENGISHFSHFIRNLFAPQSRSGGGLQTKNTVRQNEFKTRAYLSKLFKNLIANFKSKR